MPRVLEICLYPTVFFVLLQKGDAAMLEERETRLFKCRCAAAARGQSTGGRVLLASRQTRRGCRHSILHEQGIRAQEMLDEGFITLEESIGMDFEASSASSG